MYLWPLLSLLGRLARNSCRKWPGKYIHAIFPFQKKTHVNPNFVVFKPANREFGLMRTTPVFHIRMPSWPPKRHTAESMSKPKNNVFDGCWFLAMLLRWPSSCANSSLFQLSCGEEIKVHRLHWPIGLDNAQHHCSMPHVLKSQPILFSGHNEKSRLHEYT